MNTILSWFSVLIMTALFAIGTLYFGFFSSPYSLTGLITEKQIAPFAAVVLFIAILFLPRKSTANAKYKTVLWFIMVLLAFPLAVTRFIFGNNDIDAILIFFRDNQADDIAVIATDSFSTPITLSVVVFALMCLGAFYLLSRKQHFDTILLAIAALFVVISPITQFAKNHLVENELQASFHPVTETSMQITQRPDTQRNLVLIYVESLERTYTDLPETQAAYAPIQQLASNSTEATNIHQIFGTTYTIAGIVASQCGVPLMAPGLGNVFFKKGTQETLESLLPALTCLGDVLSDDGYTLSYMNGADLNRFSKRGFLKSHGYTRLKGSGEVSPDIMSGRSNPFGMNDALLFEYIYDEYDHLSAQPNPFALSMLTLTTHGPDAFLDNDCMVDEAAKSKLPAAIACSAKQISDFASYVRQNPATHDTDIVVLSDHLALSNTLRTALNTEKHNRRNLFFINSSSPAQIINRDASMLDIYPTLLENLGYTLENGQANLGRSLFNTNETLVERFGAAGADKLLKGNQALSKHLWRTADQ
jgi:phosphoglycerol transferase